MVPVSYTHLDVYKRQVMGSCDLTNCRPILRAKSIEQKFAWEPESSNILTGNFLPTLLYVIQTAVDNNTDLLVCDFSEHWLLTEVTSLLGT